MYLKHLHSFVPVDADTITIHIPRANEVIKSICKPNFIQMCELRYTDRQMNLCLRVIGRVFKVVRRVFQRLLVLLRRWMR
jgi:hypothetical protein